MAAFCVKKLKGPCHGFFCIFRYIDELEAN